MRCLSTMQRDPTWNILFAPSVSASLSFVRERAEGAVMGGEGERTETVAIKGREGRHLVGFRMGHFVIADGWTHHKARRRWKGAEVPRMGEQEGESRDIDPQLSVCSPGSRSAVVKAARVG
jgi:hypothetical protein